MAGDHISCIRILRGVRSPRTRLACKTLQTWASHIASLMPTSARVLQCTDLSRLPSQQLQKASICLLHLHREWSITCRSDVQGNTLPGL